MELQIINIVKEVERKVLEEFEAEAEVKEAETYSTSDGSFI